MKDLSLQPIAPLGVIIVLGVLALAGCLWVGFKSRPDAGRWWLRSVLVLLFVALALGPATPITRPQQVLAGVDVFFVVDRTGSMAGEDWNGQQTRLAGVQHDIHEAVAQLPGMRYSIISFDSKSNRTLPLTSDVRAVFTWADNLRQEITTYSSGSALNRVSETLLQTLQISQEQRPDNLRLVYFFTDGENTAEPDPQAPEFSQSAQFIDGGAVFGYGTLQGGYMREHTGGAAPGPDSPFIMDPNTGQIAVTKIDEQVLQDTATQLGIPYVHRTVADSLEQVIDPVQYDLITVEGGRKVVSYQTHLWIICIPLVALLGVEAWRIGARFGKRGEL